MNILKGVFTKTRCINCNYHCVENYMKTLYPKHDRNYPKINKGCCPKEYPMTIYLRNLAGVWNR